MEDDYDSEFRYEGPPISSLQGLDSNVVVYIGTFSKILSPALRIGYLVLPRPLIEQCRTLKWFSDLHTPSLEQLVLARFIEGRDTLKRFLRENFGDNVKVTGDTTGLHLIAEFKDVRFTNDVLDRMQDAGVLIHAVLP